MRLADRDIEAARAQVRQAAAGRTQAESVSTGRILSSPSSGIVGDLAVHAGDGQFLGGVLGDVGDGDTDAAGQFYFRAEIAAHDGTFYGIR